MEQNKTLKQKIEASSGTCKPALVFKHAKVVNVFTEQLEEVDVAVEGGYIVGMGSYEGVEERDLHGAILCPGFLDGHIHLESSMIAPTDFSCAVLPHGTTTVITDPHEITNVAGTAGLRYMMQATKDLDIDVFFMLPSCVPATDLDEAGAKLDAKALEPYYEDARVLGLAELMDFYGAAQGEVGILDKVTAALSRGKLVDGHAPFLKGKNLNAYIMAGVTSDHECSDIAEAKEKLARGQWIMIREGTAAKNLEALMPMFEAPYYQRAMLVTDDKHPGDLIRHGHIDYIIRTAIERGADPIRAIKMGSFHTASYFGLKNRGAIAPGYVADLVVLKDLKSIEVQQVYKAGRLIAEAGKCLLKSGKEQNWDAEIQDRVFDSFHMKEIEEKDLHFAESGEHQRVISLLPHQLITTERIVPYREHPGVAAGVDLEEDIVKLAVLERHHHTGHIGLGFLGGYGLKKGAVASSIAHDSHNLIIAGTNDRDMMLAGNCVRKNKGGLAMVMDGTVLGELPLPIAGLMTEASAEEVEEILSHMKAELRKLGIPDTVDPFMT
ncbi:MAG: adenine deaminase, partial [Hungatella sp.]